MPFARQTFYSKNVIHESTRNDFAAKDTRLINDKNSLFIKNKQPEAVSYCGCFGPRQVVCSKAWKEKDGLS